MYSVLIYMFGMDAIVEDFEELGTVMTVVTLILGNITLFLLDVNLTYFMKRRKRK